MKKELFILGIISLLILLQLTSCSRRKTNELTEIPPPKVGLVSSTGGFNDRGFNQLALIGLQNAEKELGVKTASRESIDTSDFTPNINSLIQEGYDLIILLGYEAAGAVASAAKKNPTIHFVLLDYSNTDIPANVSFYVYQVDQSSFLCGFLGAYWAQVKDPQNPVAGWIGGMDIPVIQQFRTGYMGGIQYFNTKYGKTVSSTGFFATSFSDTLQGAKLADSLIQLGADVIFPFAGKSGNGSLYKIKEKGKWGIGVDFDQYVSIPEVSDILLTSCLKKMDNSVYNIIYWTKAKGFSGHKIEYGNLSTVDIEIAPFHDYNALIPDSIKNELNTIRNGIKNGTIPTGL
ncbi:MAG: BMP family ABC transporter substrate-binding protein [Bacteroidetes bacterium]|nr:BMP family ABC transporter substrate-binding protein [Bacteroidota bacterium]